MYSYFLECITLGQGCCSQCMRICGRSLQSALTPSANCKTKLHTLVLETLFQKKEIYNSGNKGAQLSRAFMTAYPSCGRVFFMRAKWRPPEGDFPRLRRFFCWSDDATCCMIQVNILVSLRVRGSTHLPSLQLLWKRSGSGGMPLFCCSCHPKRQGEMWTNWEESLVPQKILRIFLI